MNQGRKWWMAMAGLGLALLGASRVSAQGPFPFQNPSLPTAQRVDDLVSRMTLTEKAAQMGTDAPAIPRLGIPAYFWWSESLHGDAVGPATVFPEPIGLAATFDLGLHTQVADAIGDEDRAWYNKTGAVGYPSAYHGLTFFAPNINIFRDPRWGRGQETYGEDPYLTAQFGVAYIKALQGNDPKYFKVIATSKHYAVHSGPEPERHRFDAVVSPYDLYDTYLPAFQATVQKAHVQSVMGAYSSLYGVPANASDLLLKQNLRDKWGFDGYVVSDCGAIGDIFYNHHYAKSTEEAAADAVKAGCDLDCGGEYNALPNAVKQGLITEAEIDRSVKRLFTARMQLGMFDPPAQVRYAQIPAGVIDSPAHRQLALRAARESLVLLKNQGGRLPLSASVKSLAVIGPNADDVGVLLGNYNGTPSHAVTALQGIRQRAGAGVRVEYVKGSTLTGLSELTPVPASALRSGGQPGLSAEYFSTEDLTGAPFATRRDAQVDLNWARGNPVPGLPVFHVSARWTGELVAPAGGEYTLGVRGDDGFRLYVNDQKVIDDWGVHPPDTRNYTLTLKAGQAVPIRLEYFQAEGGAEVSLQWKQPGGNKFDDALAAANRADAVIYVGGISSRLEGEEGTNGGGDRTDLDLPAVQDQLLKALYATGKPVILVLMNGSALSVNWAQAHLPAIVEAWYPGEEGGTALADVLFGDYSPSGRLPVTFYTGVGQLPPFRDYAMKARTYRYFPGKPLYPFGYGLSYTRFSYSDLRLPKSAPAGRPVQGSVTVENVGSRAGDEVVELYLRPDPKGKAREIAPGQPMPRLALAGFTRLSLAPRGRTVVHFTLAPDQLMLLDAQGNRTVQPPAWQVYVGGSQPDLVAKQSGGVSGMLTVKYPERKETRLNVQHLIDWVTHLIAALGYPGVLLLMALESACIPIPSEAIMPFAGSLVVTDPARGFNIHTLAFVGACGNLLGSTVAYWVGHIGGRPFLEKYGKFVLIRKRDIDKSDAFFQKYGEWTALFSRVLPIVRTFISLPAGIARMNFPKFCAFTFIGALPFCYLLAWAGVKLGEHWDRVHAWLQKADFAVTAVLVVLFALWLWHHLRPEPEEAGTNATPAA